MILVCSSTEDYLPKIRPFLQSANAHFPGVVYLVCVECDPPAGYLDGLASVQAIRITHEHNHGAPEGTNSVQHGSFLRVMPHLDDDELVIYSDGDIILQRPFTNEEMSWLSGWSSNSFGASWNSGPNERLITEAMRLLPKIEKDNLTAVWGDMVNREACFNIGVTVARAGAWRKLYSGYMEYWQRACDTFSHRARQQWLVCYEIAALGFNAQILPYSFHTHKHYGLPFGVWFADNVAWYGNEPIAFRHRF